jgi:BMFP domain-containing protein YqiC
MRGVVFTIAKLSELSELEQRVAALEAKIEGGIRQ